MIHLILTFFTWLFCRILWGFLKLALRIAFWIIKCPFTLIFARRFPKF